MLVWVVFLVGVSVLLYPTVSNYWNNLVASKTIQNYTAAVEQMSTQDNSAEFAMADAYNQSLTHRLNRFQMTTQETHLYDSILDIGSGGVMGVLTIPKINVKLPIYHGTSAAVLQSGVGHLAGSSLPVGGSTTHAVLSGHRGLPSAELLSNIDKMVVGDKFQITVLDRTMVYQVYNISVVDPEDLRQLAIISGEDLVTLVTCTPYGVNTQRLLVQGARVYTSAATVDDNTAGAVTTAVWPTWLLGGVGVVGGFAYAAIRLITRKKGRALCEDDFS